MGRYARELILEARQEPHRLLERKKFWKRVVFDEFLAEITRLLYTDGAKAFELASLGPAFAKLVAAESGEDPSLFMVRAYGHLGSAHLVLADYPAAGRAYDTAETYPAPEAEHADINIRRSYLRLYEGSAEAGYSCAHSAVEVYRNTDDLLVNRHPLGLALTARGLMHYYCSRLGNAAVDFSAAVTMINHRTKPQTYFFTLHNLSVILIEAIAPSRLGTVLQNLDASYNRFVGSKRHIAKYKIRWLQALGQKRFGATRQAERFFKMAFNGFVDMKASAEVAMVSLDIALLFIEEGRIDETKELARHAYKIASALGMNADALAALNIWQQATEAELTQEFVSSIRTTVTEKAQPFGF
jgi:hypothetical protein